MSNSERPDLPELCCPTCGAFVGLFRSALQPRGFPFTCKRCKCTVRFSHKRDLLVGCLIFATFMGVYAVVWLAHSFVWPIAVSIVMALIILPRLRKVIGEATKP